MKDEAPLHTFNGTGIGGNEVDRFSAQSNRTYVLRVSSYQPQQTGGYELSVVLPPSITSFSPGGGIAGTNPNGDGGTEVTITGGPGFDTVPFVYFGGGAVNIPHEQADSYVKVLVPAGATTGVLRVQTSYGEAVSSRSEEHTSELQSQ